MAGALSNLPGGAGRAAAVVNLGVGAFQAGANMGASFAQNRKGVQRLRELRGVMVQTQIRSQRMQSRISGLRDKLGTYERERSSLMTRMSNGGTTAQRRSLRSLDTTIRRINGDIQRREAERSVTTRRIASLTKATQKMEGLLTGNYNTAAKVMKTVEERNAEFRRGRRQTSNLKPQGKRGPKPDRRSWQERFGLDSADERTDKKCGQSGIAANKKCTKGTGRGRQVAKAAATAALLAGGAVALRQASKTGLGKTQATQGAKGPWVASKGRRMTATEVESLRRMREKGQGKLGAQPRRRTGDEVEHHGETFSDYNQPKRTPNHPTKSHAVLAKEGETVKLIRFGQQGVQGSPPKEGESEAYRARRLAWKERHAKNIAKGKMSAAYWANRAKWDAAGEQRLGKPCGESHIPRAKKCSKGSGVAGKAALAATGAAAVALFVKRKEAQSALTKAVLSAERALAGKTGRQAYEEARMKVPESLRAQADKAVGTTKTVLGVMANHASSPIEVLGINARQGFVTGRFKKGEEFISIGSVGRDVIEARSEKSQGRANEWTVTFTVNSSLTRETPRSATEARRIFNTARAMIKDQASHMPKGSTLFAEGAVGDGSEKARNRIYKRWGFQDDGDGGLTMNAADF